MEKDEIRVGLIGANKVGTSHFNGIEIAGNGIKLTAVTDIDLPRAKAMAEKCTASAYTDYHEMLKKEKLDIVIVATPHSLHCEEGINVANAGVNLLMEKPLATNMEDAYRIVDACRKNNVKFSISHVHRFREELQTAKNCMKSGVIGDPYLVMDFFGITGGLFIPGWTYEKELSGGGVLMYGAIHDFDYISWLVGSRVKEVYCETVDAELGHGTEKAAVCNLHFENGLLGILTAGNTNYKMVETTKVLEIYGTEAMIRVNTGKSFYFNGHDQAYEQVSMKDNPFQSQIREFAAAIREDRDPWITAEDGLHSLAVCMACYESALTKRVVSLSNVMK